MASDSLRGNPFTMAPLRPNQAAISDDVLLDGRLALFHRRERWLAVADIHFGYELSQRAAGRLVPMWGMSSTEERLQRLLEDYRPERLIILGDLVHDHAAAWAAREFLQRLATRCEVIVINGNHDRRLGAEFGLVDSWETEDFHFHHGHCAIEPTRRVQIIGHHHPAASISDGAGLHLKCPAFVQQERCWIMPAFSPWSSGSTWRGDEQSSIWLCTAERVLRLPEKEAA